MNRIIAIGVSWDRAEAVCEGKDGEVQVTILPEKRKFTVTENGIVKEEYRFLEESVYSPYADVFILLQRELNVLYDLRWNIREQIQEENKSFERKGAVLLALNSFTLRGNEAYTASVCYDFSAEIPQFTYLLQDRSGTVLEAYEALYRTVDSIYYPVFADLDNYIQKKQSEESAE